MNTLQHIVQRHKAGENNGIYAIGSVYQVVIEAAIYQTLNDASVLFIEETPNQVDQFVGHTGITPDHSQDFITGQIALSIRRKKHSSPIYIG